MLRTQYWILKIDKEFISYQRHKRSSTFNKTIVNKFNKDHVIFKLDNTSSENKILNKVA